MSPVLKVLVESPSNIAIVKYWGKKGSQLPMNASMSFTLSESKTVMEVEYCSSEKFELDFLFESLPNEKFATKIENKLMAFSKTFSFIEKGKFRIRSHNTFPHSTGIASSASAMSALALAVTHLANKLDKIETVKIQETASYLARIGSGSASRSIYGLASVWGKHHNISGSNDEYAIGIDSFLHPIFKTLNDAILIVDDKEKSVSSTAGHELMNNHPHRDSRLKFATQNLSDLIDALKRGDFDRFSQISEHEALDLHSMMMTSNPSFILLAPESLAIIKKLREFRSKTDIKITFTIDAGPNIHVLYPEESKEKVEIFLESLYNADLCKTIIKDKVGFGPKVK